MTCQPVLVLWTCGNFKEAEKISAQLLEKRLVACHRLSPGSDPFSIGRENSKKNGNAR